MKVDMSDPRVEGLAKQLAKQRLIADTGMGPVAAAMPDITDKAMEKVWAQTAPEDEVVRNKFRNNAVEILAYLDKVSN